MKREPKFESVPYGVLAAGVIGLLLRLWLHSTRDDSGFVTRGHISGVLLLVLTAGVLIGLFLICRYFRQANKYDFNFPASVVSALGSALGAAGIAIVSVTELLAVTTVEGRITALLGLLAAGALGFCAYSRWKGEKVSALFYGVVCVYLMLRLFSMYRLWCTDPQLEEYTFELMALACVMLAAYHRAAFNADFGSRRAYVFFDLAAVYFCCLSLTGGGAVIYIAMGVWMFTDLCKLTPMSREQWENV